MKRVLSFTLLGVLLQVSSVCGQNAKSNLDASQKAFILSRFCTEVKYNFVHYNELTLDWDSLCMASLPQLTATQSDNEFIDGMKRLCVQLHDGHTSIYPSNNPKDPDNWIRPFPMTTKRVGDRVFVTSVLNSEFEKKGLCYGCEILEIDSENVIDYGNNHIRPFLASSTPQWSDYASFTRFDLTKAEGTKVSRILFRNLKGKTFTIESNRNIDWDLQSKSSTLDFKVLRGNIGFLCIKSFQNGAFRKEVFDSIYNEIVKTDALIIDIRDNGGGNSSYADYIIRHLDDKPIRFGRWSTRLYNAAHASWGYPQEWYMESPDAMDPIKNKPIFKKPIMLLVNATTFSSAENFCVTFQGLKRGKIVGTPTGGSTGNPIFIDLGFGIGCSICTRNEWDVEGRKFIGIGVIPDVEVKENADMFLKDKDVVIEKALELINQRSK